MNKIRNKIYIYSLLIFFSSHLKILLPLNENNNKNNSLELSILNHNDHDSIVIKDNRVSGIKCQITEKNKNNFISSCKINSKINFNNIETKGTFVLNKKYNLSIENNVLYIKNINDFKIYYKKNSIDIQIKLIPKSKLLKKQSRNTNQNVIKKYHPWINSANLDKGKEMNKFIVVIDPGHGGIDSGTVAKIDKNKEIYEKNITLNFANKIKKKLNDKNITTYLTRDGDYSISTISRAGYARKMNANLVISIHADYTNKKNVSGVAFYLLSKTGYKDFKNEIISNKNYGILRDIGLQKSDTYITENVIDMFNRKTEKESVKIYDFIYQIMKKDNSIVLNKYIHRGNYKVLKNINIPSLLIEVGFLSNKQDIKLLQDENYINKISENISNGIEKYKKNISIL